MPPAPQSASACATRSGSASAARARRPLRATPARPARRVPAPNPSSGGLLLALVDDRELDRAQLLELRGNSAQGGDQAIHLALRPIQLALAQPIESFAQLHVALDDSVHPAESAFHHAVL